MELHSPCGADEMPMVASTPPQLPAADPAAHDLRPRAFARPSGPPQSLGVPIKQEIKQETKDQDDARRSEPRPRKRRFRKATHTVRKEEKLALLEQLKGLQAQIDRLQQQVRNTSPEEQRRLQQEHANYVLHQTLRNHNLAVASTQSIFSEFLSLQQQSPLDTYIHLRSDWAQRRAALYVMKAEKIAQAQRFLAHRCRFVDPLRAFTDHQMFETTDGDFCSVRCHVIRFEGAHSVKQVFDVLSFQMCNIEIHLSEQLGTITVREDDDNGDRGISQNRLVTTTPWGVRSESNNLFFSDYRPCDLEYGDGHEYAIFVFDYVNQDDLHPYRSHERVRKEVSGVMQLKAYRAAPTDELTVVMQRFSYVTMRKPGFPIASEIWRAMKDNVDPWNEAMVRSVVDSLRSGNQPPL